MRVIVVDAITVDDVRDYRSGGGAELERAGSRPGPFTERLAVRRGLMREAQQRDSVVGAETAWFDSGCCR